MSCFLLLLLLIVGATVTGGASPPDLSYSVIIDAGSTGSRLHVFSFVSGPGDDAPTVSSLSNEVFEEVKPGLSSFANAQEAGESLRPLMLSAMSSVPETKRVVTGVELKATAGLRLIGATASSAILEAVMQLFRDFPFHTSESSVEIMDDDHEGPYGWLTINYLLGSLRPHGREPIQCENAVATAAAIDMGGASTQVVFEWKSGSSLLSGSRSEDDALTEQRSHAYPVPWLSSTDDGCHGTHGTNTVKPAAGPLALYQHSHLGYGLMEARKAVLSSRSDACGAEGTFATCVDACLNFLRPASAEKHCKLRTAAVTHLSIPWACSINATFQPPLADVLGTGGYQQRGRLYAFSYYYDRFAHFFSKPQVANAAARHSENAGMEPSAGVVNLSWMRSIAMNLCGTRVPTDLSLFHPWGVAETDILNWFETQRTAPFACFDATYLYAVLAYGYELPPHTEIVIAKKVRGVETAWPLGAALAALSSRTSFRQTR